MAFIFEELSGAKALRQEGKSAQNIALFNARVQEAEAKAEIARAGFASRRQAKQAAAIKSALEAKLGVAGGLGSLVAADLAAEQAAELELENLLIGFEGETRARRALNQAELDRLSGEFAKQKGKAAGRAANIQFGVQLATLGLLTGFGGGGAPPPPPTFNPAGTGVPLSRLGTTARHF